MGSIIGTTQLRAYLSPNNNLPTTENGLLDACITRAESAIASYTRRTFVGTAGTAYYSRYAGDQVRDKALYLDQDLHTLVALYNGNGGAIPVGSVWLEPRNDGPPYRILRLKSSEVWIWDTDGEITVAGTWGYGTVAPADVVQATLRTASYYYRGKDQSGFSDVTGFPDGGEQPIVSGLPNDVRWLLNPYKSRSGGFI